MAPSCWWSRVRSGVALSAIVLLPNLVAACRDSDPAEGQANLAPPPVTVAVPLVHRLVEWEEYTGRFEPTAAVEIRARVSGYLEEVKFDDGAIVKEGDVLFVIDRRPYQALVAKAEADLAAAQAQADFARSQLDRAEALVDRSVVSEASYDERVQQQRAAEAAVLQARAALQTAELDLSFTEVRAPIAGRVSKREIDVGNLVTGDPNATLLTTIVALDPLYFAFDMSEANFLAYQRAVVRGAVLSTRDNETEVEMRLPDEEDWAYHGTMNFVDNRIDPESGTIRARALVSNPEEFITPGQFGQLRLPGSFPYDAVLVPESALVTDQSNRVVMMVAEDGTVVPQPVRLGPAYGDGLRIVREGLTGKEQIIINGLLRARPGSKVTPEPGTIPAPGGA